MYVKFQLEIQVTPVYTHMVELYSWDKNDAKIPNNLKLENPSINDRIHLAGKNIKI